MPEPYRSHDWALVPAKPGLQGWILMNEWICLWEKQIHDCSLQTLHTMLWGTQCAFVVIFSVLWVFILLKYPGYSERALQMYACYKYFTCCDIWLQSLPVFPVHWLCNGQGCLRLICSITILSSTDDQTQRSLILEGRVYSNKYYKTKCWYHSYTKYIRSLWVLWFILMHVNMNFP